MDKLLYDNTTMKLVPYSKATFPFYHTHFSSTMDVSIALCILLSSFQHSKLAFHTNKQEMRVLSMFDMSSEPIWI